MIPMVAFGWTGMAETALALLAVVGVWKRIDADPVDDLTERLRRPTRWKLMHPIRAIRRSL